MANIAFKRGLSTSLPSGSAVQDGAFYLTTDSNRLYVGAENGLVEINRYVHVVANQNGLSTTNATTGDFAYIEDVNILAVYDGSAWRQVNPDTNTESRLGTIISKKEAKDNKVTYTLTIPTQRYKIGASGVETEIDDTEVTQTVTLEFDVADIINGINVALDIESDDNEVTITTIGEGADTAAPGITLQGGDNLTITEEDGTVTFNSKDTKPVVAKSTVASDGEEITVILGLSDGTTVEFSGDLNVDVDGAIEDALKNLNAMTYKGTINSDEDLPLTPNFGDVYLVATEGEYQGRQCKVGDFFIATGDEGIEGTIISGLEWTYVPAGDEINTDTQYQLKLVDKTVKLVTTNGEDAGAFGIGGGTDITVTNNAGTFVVAHADKSGYTDPTTTAAGQLSAGGKLQVVTGATVENGHVIALKTKEYTLPEEQEIPEYTYEGSVTASNSKATISTKLKKDGEEVDEVFETTIGSDSLVFNATGNAISINLEWGTF